MKLKAQTKIVKELPLRKEQIRVKIKGITSYLSEKMPVEIAEKYDKKKSNQTVERDTRSELMKVEEKIHRTEDGKAGIPAIAFHKAMIEVAPYMDGLDKKKVTGSLRILGNIIPIKYSKQILNKTVGRSSGIVKAPRLIIRPEFQDWSCELDILYNANNISAEQIINLLNLAGFQMGVGGWRPHKSGSFGQFEVLKKS